MARRSNVIVITGASDGIGAVAARHLKEAGNEVIIIGRSPDKTKRVADELQCAYYIVDFAKLEEVRTLAKSLNRDYPRIDVLINNAGGIFGKRELTIDGNEKTLQINHLAPMLLTTLLIDNLLRSHATVINTSSIANYRFGNIDVADLNLEHNFSSNRAYGNAKLGNILFTQELHRRYHEQGLSAVAVHPGNIASNFASDTTSWLRFIYRTPLSRLILQTTEQGAEPLVWLAGSKPGKNWKSGEYYEQHKIGKRNKQAHDPEFARLFWNASISAL